MSRKTFEMSFKIGGRLDHSFSGSFSSAGNKLESLKNEARQTQRALDQLGRDFRAGKVHQEQYAESTEKLTRKLRGLELAQKNIRGFQTGLNRGLNTAKNVAGLALLGTTAVATGVALNSLDKAGSFQQQITKVGVHAEATGNEMKKLRSTALELGADSSLNANEVAVAMDELSTKGMNAKKIVGAMPGIISAAEASGEDLAMTSDVVTSALNAFELKATQASHIADVMAMSANKTAAGIEDLGYSFKYAAPVAHTLGIGLEELAAATGVMVDKGLSGEQAGTSLRMALVRLSNPPKKAKAALDKLNLSVIDSKGKFKSITKLAGDWNNATKDLTDTQKVQYAATIFGTEAATGMLNLFASGPKKIDSMTKSLINSTGAASKAAKAMKDNYAGAKEQMMGSIESSQIMFMTPVLPVFQDLFNGISATLDKNAGGIEKAGERFASGLKDVFEPFSTQEPIKPQFDGDYKKYDEAMVKYQKDISKFKTFNSMDFGDKVVYMLDEASIKIEKWLEGSGGESMNKIFSKLGEIAAKAWFNALTTTLQSSASNLAQGNIASGVGLGAAAWMMGGGVLAKGAYSAGKFGYNKMKGAGTGTAKGASSFVQAGEATASSAAAATQASKGGFTKTALSKSGSLLGKSGRVLGKVALPATVAFEGYNIYKSKDKVKATAEAGAGLAGGLGGAKLGAAIGTAIAPGIGTAIGGALGGLVGYAAGKWAGDKVVNATRQATQPPPQKQTGITMASNQGSTAKNVQATGLNVSTKNSANKVKNSLDILAASSIKASGWLESLSGISSAGHRVETALNNLANRINKIQVPQSIGQRVAMR